MIIYSLTEGPGSATGCSALLHLSTPHQNTHAMQVFLLLITLTFRGIQADLRDSQADLSEVIKPTGALAHTNLFANAVFCSICFTLISLLDTLKLSIISLMYILSDLMHTASDWLKLTWPTIRKYEVPPGHTLISDTVTRCMHTQIIASDKFSVKKIF